jgi:hypothetical protein
MKNYVNGYTISSNVEQPKSRNAYRRKRKASVGTIALKMLLWFIYCLFELLYRNRYAILSAVKGIALYLLGFVTFFHLGQMEHPYTDTMSRLGSASIQALLPVVVIYLGKPTVVDFVEEIKRVLSGEYDDEFDDDEIE